MYGIQQMCTGCTKTVRVSHAAVCQCLNHADLGKQLLYLFKKHFSNIQIHVHVDITDS